MKAFGRGACALAVLVLVAAACSRGDDADSTTAPPATTTAAGTTAAATTVAAAEPPTAGPATTAAGDTSAAPTSAPGATTAAPATEAPTTTVADGAVDPAALAAACAAEPLEGTEVGVTPTDITITVMADTGSSLAPGFAQGSVDAITGFAEWVNANGGVGCRQLKVQTWDSKFDPTEVKNGQIDACARSLALVGSYAVFNPDPSAMEQCTDQAGAVTGLPNVTAFAVDANEMCSPMTIGVNTRAEACPVVPDTEREFVRIVGAQAKLLEWNPGLHGTYVANADLPSTVVSAISDIRAQEQAGIVFDGKLKQYSRDEQSAYTSRVQYLKQGSNFVYDGSADFALALYMREAVAQGVDMSKVVWSCGVSCYTRALLSTGGNAVEGAYIWIPFLPFEEADTNEALNAYVTSVGTDKVDTYGAISWEAALAFRQAVDTLVVEQGPNAITRANLLDALRNLENFDADGMAGVREHLGDTSPCFVMVQIQDGAYQRVWPEEPGTLDCAPSNLVTVTVNPEQGVETELT